MDFNSYIPNIIELCQKYSVTNLYVFGFFLTDRFSANSDIDFLINFSNNLSIDQYTDNYFNLHSDLEKLLKTKIDLITERSLKNPYLIEDINTNKELIYNAA